VESAATGEGVSGVDLSLRSRVGRDPGLTARTARDGEVDLRLPVGTYRVEATPVWTEHVGAEVTVRAGAAAALTLELSAPRVETRTAGRGRGVWHGLSVPAGLAGLSVYDVLQGRRGDLWLAIEGGLSRYDGTKVTTYTVADGLPHYYVNTVHEDDQGVIWAGTGGLWGGSDGGLAQLDTRGVLSLPAPLADIRDNINAIAEDAAGRVWLAGSRLLRWDGTRPVDLTGGLDPAPRVLFAALIDHQGRAWVGGATDTGGAVWRVGADSTHEYHATSTPVFSMAEDTRGDLWVGTGELGSQNTEGQILRLREGILEAVPRTWTLSGPVKDIAVAADGDVWFALMGWAGRGGVLQFDGKRFEEFGAADGLGYDGASSVAVDREGALWVGTGYHAVGKGVRRFDRDRLVSYGMTDGLGQERVLGLEEDGVGRLWMIGDHTLTRFDGDGFASVRLGDESQGQRLGGVAIDGQDRIWTLPAGSGERHIGLIGYDGTTVQRIDRTQNTDLSEVTGRDATAGWRGPSLAQSFRGTPLDSLFGRWWDVQLRHVLTGADGTLWVGTFFTGVYGFNGDERVHLTQARGLTDDHVTVLFEDAGGDLWIGTGYGGVCRFDGERITETLTVNDGLGANFVSDICQTRDGRMLFATFGGGLSIYDGLLVQTLDAEDGLADDFVSGVIEDTRGDIWVGTNRGLTRYRPRHTPPLVRITRVVTTLSVQHPKVVSVSSTQDLVTVYFEGRTLKAMGRDLAYVYRLRGHEDDWGTTRDGSVVYDDLPIGDYTFEVRAVSQDLDYSEAATMGLRVEPPYVQLALQAGLALSLVGVGLASTYGLRRRRDQRRAEQALMREMEEELQDARRMQMSLLPTSSPDVPGLSVYGRCVSASRVGGDFFQYLEGEDGITVSLADVTGHAMEAAIPAVMFSGVLDKQMEIPTTLEERFAGLNRSLCRSLGEHTFVCLSMLEIDTAAHAMRLANCGCPYPLHYRAAAGAVEEIQVVAYALGIRADTQYPATQVELQVGDYVVLHSDGFSEATDADGEQFGFEQTAEVLRQGCSEGLSPEGLIDRLIGEVKAFTGDEPQADDMTCVVVKVEE